MSKHLEGFGYNEHEIKRNELFKVKTEIEKEFNEKYELLNQLKMELENLQSKTIDENIAAKNINQQLELLGNQSFKLNKAEVSGQEGQYQILSYDNTVRDVDTLSTGEKNIVAFLWFLNDLESIKTKSKKEKVIIFDDPMNSNDDTVQYLMISHLQRLLKNLNDDEQIFILTHSIHFYLNTRYKWWSSKNKKATFHFYKAGDKSTIKKIKNQEEDIKTGYESIWEEVRFLYESQKPKFMLNPLRRIMETYKNFNNLNTEDIYGEDTELRKLFDANSHASDINDFEFDLNGKDEEVIMGKVEFLFSRLNAEKHYRKYWKDE